MASVAARATWVFGTDPDVSAGGGTHKSHNNVVGSTGAGAPFNCHGWGRRYTFLIESNDSAANYQIRTSRTSSGPWAVLSSGALTSTTPATVVYSTDGPFQWVSPRIDVMASTGSNILVRMTAIDG